MHPLLPKRAALQIPEKLISPQPATPERDDTALFYDLWLAQPSWSPIVKKPDGWITIINRSGKKVPLVHGTVVSHYRRNITLGKRFSRLTNYLLIDVDTGSPFHPRNQGIDPILAAMEKLGLCRYLLIRSSDSEGLHIYFPLDEPVSSWGIACAAHAALAAAGVKVAGGICELFPNKKAFNAEHNGHRLPLQRGSFILDDDFRCISNDKAAFFQQWQVCAAGQDDERLADELAEKPLPVPKRISIDSLPPIAWKSMGKSNDVMRQLVNYGDWALGLKTIQSLGDWMVAVAPMLSGFDEFASEESKDDLRRRGWAYRWAKSHFKNARMYAAKTSYDYNATVAAEALERLMIALDRFVIVGKFGTKKLFNALCAVSKELFGVGFSWKLFKKHKEMALAYIWRTRNLGPSTGKGEGEGLLSVKTAEPVISEAGLDSEKGLAGLSTGRCVTAIQDKGLNRAPTPSKRGGTGLEKAPKLAMDVQVIAEPSESGLGEGKISRVGKASEAVRQVENEPVVVEGVIMATAQQLMQVLGEACPFVGPGTWKIARSNVTPMAWSALQRLVGGDVAVE